MKPVDWIKDAEEPTRTYRKMIIGWQNALTSLNATVRAFNAEYLKEQEQRDTHHAMREIAIKKLIISCLFELKPQLDTWFFELRKGGLLSQEVDAKKKEVRSILKQIRKFDTIRNMSFHFGDFNEPTESLISLYQEIQDTDLALLNRILENMIDLGEMLKQCCSKGS